MWLKNTNKRTAKRSSEQVKSFICIPPVTFLLTNGIFATSLSLTLAFLSEICWDLYHVAAVCDWTMTWSKYPAHVIWYNSMEITEVTKASWGRESNSGYMCVWFFRNIFSFLSTIKTELSLKSYFVFPHLPECSKGTCHLVEKKTSWAIPASKIILFISPEEQNNSCVGRGEWLFHPASAFDSCDFMSCGQNQEMGRSNFSWC